MDNYCSKLQVKKKKKAKGFGIENIRLIKKWEDNERLDMPSLISGAVSKVPITCPMNELPSVSLCLVTSS